MPVFGFLTKIISKIVSSTYSYRIGKLRKVGVKIGEECENYNRINCGSDPYLISIGNKVRITKGVPSITHGSGAWVMRNFKNLPNIDLVKPIKTNNNVLIGMNSTIMSGVTIENNYIIGYRSIIAKDVIKNEMWAGVPAKFVDYVDNYFQKHFNEFPETKNYTEVEKRKYLNEKYNELHSE